MISIVFQAHLQSPPVPLNNMLARFFADSFKCSFYFFSEVIERCAPFCVYLGLDVPSQKKITGVKSGDRGGHGMLDEPLPIQRFGNFSSSQLRTLRPKCGGAPSRMNLIEFSNRFSMKYEILKASFFFQPLLT